MDNLQTEPSLKRIEIVVAVQKLVLGLQTESGNQAIDSLADRIAARTQVPIILGGDDGQATASGLKNLELQEVGLGSRKRALVPNALEYFAKDEVRQSEPLPLQFAVEPMRFGILGAAQIVDPHGGVDDDHYPA
jgi:hypothetical protein